MEADDISKSFENSLTTVNITAHRGGTANVKATINHALPEPIPDEIKKQSAATMFDNFEECLRSSNPSMKSSGSLAKWMSERKTKKSNSRQALKSVRYHYYEHRSTPPNISITQCDKLK